MAITTVSSREFNQHASETKKAANNGPVFITDRGRPAYVLLTMEDYQTLTGTGQDIATLLAMPDMGDFELSIPARRDFPRAAELD
jgi:prevent-host-death family protein